MRLFDRFRNAAQASDETDEVQGLRRQLHAYRGQYTSLRDDLCRDAMQGVQSEAAVALLQSILFLEGHFVIPEGDTRRLAMSEMWEYKKQARAKLTVLKNPKALEETLNLIMRNVVPFHLPPNEGEASFYVPVHDLLEDFHQVAENLVGLIIGQRGEN